MTFSDSKPGAIRWRAAVVEDGVEIEAAVEEDFLAGVMDIMGHLERTLTPEASVRLAVVLQEYPSG